MKKKYKDGLTRPFEKPLTENQNRLYVQIRELFAQDFVIKMTYPELFDVLDRIKLSYQLMLLRREGKIKFIFKNGKKDR